MSNMTLPFIRALAEEYARKYNSEKLVPFPYQNIVKAHKNVHVFFQDMEDGVSGAIRLQGENFDIFINAKKPKVRQNFTLAHELGHFFLHQDILKKETGIIDGDTAFDSSLYRLDAGSEELIERQANNFAASLLMPAELVVKGWEAVEDIEKLARIFRVSVVAMSIRLTQLGLVS